MAIGELSVTPLRSTWFHVIGDELDWAEVAALLDGGGADWDGALFAPRTDTDRRAAAGRRCAASRCGPRRAGRGGPPVLNAEHFFDRGAGG